MQQLGRQKCFEKIPIVCNFVTEKPHTLKLVQEKSTSIYAYIYMVS